MASSPTATRDGPRTRRLREGRRLVFSACMYPFTLLEAEFRDLIAFLKAQGYSGFALWSWTSVAVRS